ncbi:MAG TPA: pentapeptide repeat-containing protein [Gemmataceae bacterium]|nr:pentapeptide repeat-containing protein [Gemmataceae bacterium]
MSKKATLSRPKPKSEPREALLGELRDGADGVRRWNAVPLDRRRAAGGFAGADLSGADLAGADLGGLNFAGAVFDGATLTDGWLLESDLSRASFRHADLTRSWCAGAHFVRANFHGATLRRCNLRGCDCRGATFVGADLDGATLDGADLCGADFSTANLRDAGLDGARYDEKTRWPRGFGARAALVWAGAGDPPIELDLFVKCLARLVDSGRLSRAVEMLKAERFQLYAQVESGALFGVVRSQRDPRVVYSCRLASNGSFACCSQDLAVCLGLRGALCKHVMVLLIGLVRAGEIDPRTAERWVKASHENLQYAVAIDDDLMSEALLRYRAAQAGQLDWRPTETIPEDYYAL